MALTPIINATTIAISGLTSKLNLSTAAAIKLNTALGMFAPVAIAGAVMGLVKAFEYLSNYAERQIEKIKQLKNEFDDLTNALQDNKDKIKEVTDRLKELYTLRANGSLSEYEKQELQNLEAINQELQRQIQYEEALIKIKAKALEEETLAVANAQTEYSKKTVHSEFGSRQVKVTVTEKIVEDSEDLKNYKDELDEVINKQNEYKSQLVELEKDYDKNAKAIAKNLKETEKLEKQKVELTKRISEESIELERLITKLEKENANYVGETEEGNKKKLVNEQLIKSTKDLIISINDTKKAEQELDTTIKQTNTSLGFQIKKTEDLDKLYKDITSNLEDLNQVIYDVKEGQTLSAKQVEELVLKYPELDKYIRKTAEGYTIEKSALEILNQIRQQSVNTAILAQMGITQAAYDGLRDRLKAYQIEIESINGIDDAYKAMQPYMSSGASSQLVQDTLAYGKALEKIRTLRESLSDPMYGVRESKSSSKSETSITEIEIDQFYRLQDAVNRTSNEIKKYKDYMSATDDLEKRHEYENRLIETYEKQKDQLHELAEARRSAIEKNVEYLKSQGFDVSYDKTNNILRIENEERINQLYGKNNKETNEIRKNIEDIIKKTKEWNKANQENGSEWQTINSTIKEIYNDRLKTVKETEDKIASIIKKSVDAEKKALDEKYNKFKDTIEKQKDLLDEQYEKEKYLRNLAKKEEKAQDIRSQMADLQLAATSGDYQAYQELLELQKELKEQELEIEEYKNDQAHKMKKENLDKQLKSQEDYVKQRKEYLDQEYNDDNIAIKAKQALLDGFFVDMNGNVVTFGENISNYMQQIGVSIEENLIKQLQVARTMLQELGNALGNSSLSSADMQLRKYYESLNKSVEWKNGKVYVDGQPIDTSKLKNVDGRLYGTKEILDDILSKLSNNGMLAMNNLSSMVSNLLSNITLPLTNIRPLEGLQPLMGDIYVTVEGENVDKNNATSIGYKVGQSVLDVIRRGLEKGTR